MLLGAASRRALRPLLTATQARTKFRYATTHRDVEQGGRAPTLRQLLTHLASAEVSPQLRARLAPAPGKQSRKKKRIQDDVFLSTENWKHMADAKAAFVEEYKTENVFVEAVLRDEERVKATLAEFDQRMRKRSAEEEEVLAKKRADRLARRAARRDRQARIAEGRASAQDIEDEEGDVEEEDE